MLSQSQRIILVRSKMKLRDNFRVSLALISEGWNTLRAHKILIWPPMNVYHHLNKMIVLKVVGDLT